MSNKRPVSTATPDAESTVPAKLQENPKIVEEVRAIMGEAKITGLALKELLDPKILNRLGSAFRSAANGEEAQKYRQLDSDAARRDTLAKYVLDPMKFKTTGGNRTEVHNSTADKAKGQWLTVAEIGGPMHLNNMQYAAVLAESGDLGTPRPHEDKAWLRLASCSIGTKRSP